MEKHTWIQCRVDKDAYGVNKSWSWNGCPVRIAGHDINASKITENECFNYNTLHSRINYFIEYLFKTIKNHIININVIREFIVSSL